MKLQGILAVIAMLIVLALLACAPGASQPAGSANRTEAGGPSWGETLATPVPQAPSTATPLPPPRRPVYVLDPNAGALARLSHILVIDPDRQRLAGRMATRYVPEVALAPEGRRMYVADTYWSQVTRGEVQDVLSVYDALTGEVLVDDLPVPDRLRYKVFPPASPWLFLSQDGSRLFLMKYGDSDPRQVRLAILDGATLKVLHEGPLPPCGRRIRVLADRWVCANSIPPTGPFGFRDLGMSLSLDVVDPWAGAKVETLLTVGGFQGGVAGVAAAAGGDRVYVVDRELRVAVIDVAQEQILERAKLELSEPQEVMIDAIALSPDGRRLFVGVATGVERYHGQFGDIWAYDTASWQQAGRITLRDPAMQFALSAAGDQLYAVSPVGRSLMVYDASTYEEIALLSELGGSPARVIVPGTAP